MIPVPLSKGKCSHRHTSFTEPLCPLPLMLNMDLPVFIGNEPGRQMTL